MVVVVLILVIAVVVAVAVVAFGSVKSGDFHGIFIAANSSLAS